MAPPTHPLFLVLSEAEGYTITSTTPSVTFSISSRMSTLLTLFGIPPMNRRQLSTLIHTPRVRPCNEGGRREEEGERRRERGGGRGEERERRLRERQGRFIYVRGNEGDRLINISTIQYWLHHNTHAHAGWLHSIFSNIIPYQLLPVTSKLFKWPGNGCINYRFKGCHDRARHQLISFMHPNIIGTTAKGTRLQLHTSQ